MQWEKKKEEAKTIYIIKERKDCKKEKRAIGCVFTCFKKDENGTQDFTLKMKLCTEQTRF